MRKIYLIALLAGALTSCADTEKYENEISSLQSELEAMKATMNEVIEAKEQAESEAKTELDATGIAIVDMTKLKSDYKGYVEAENRLKAKVEQMSSEIEGLEKNFGQRYEVLMNEAQNFGEEYVKEDALKLQNFEREIMEKKSDYTNKAQVMEREMTKKILDKVNGHAKKFALENGYQIILFEALEYDVFYAKDEINITDEFISSLNAAY